MKTFLSGWVLFILGTVNWQGSTRHLSNNGLPAESSADTLPLYTLYLTIDDGPLEGSPYIDTVFMEEKVPADLFLVGQHVYMDEVFENYYRELKKNKWFEFDNHSYTHANEDYKFYYSHPRMVLHDMERNNDSLHFSNRICRMPARNMWRISGKKSNDGFSGAGTANLLKRRGYKLIGWDLEWESDSLNHPVQSPDSLFQELLHAFEQKKSFVPGHIVLLCHDWMFTDPGEAKELRDFIRLVKGAGNIRFEWLKKYPLFRK